MCGSKVPANRVAFGPRRLWPLGFVVLGMYALFPSTVRAQKKPEAAPEATGQEASRTPPKFYGFVQTHYRHAFETGNDGVFDAPDFRVQRVRLGVRGDLYRWLSYEVEIDPRSPEVAGLLRDAFLSFEFIPRHQLRLGQQKTQFGYENRESSSDLFVVNRAELSDALSRGPNLRDIGLGLIGNAKLAKGWRFEDAITVVNGDGLNVQADSTRRKNVWGRAGLRYKDDPSDLTIRVGISGANGDQIAPGLDALDPTDDYRETFTRQGTDVEVDHPRFQFTAEYVRGTNVNTITTDGDERSGHYFNVVGKTRWHVGPIVRLDTFSDEFRRWTLGGYYGLPNVPLRVIVNYEYRALKDGVRGDDKLYVWAQVRF
jgi:phosphate-selective porin